MVFLDGILVVAEADINFISLALGFEVVLLKHFEVCLALLLLGRSHLVDYLDNAVDEENKEENYHENCDVGVDY